VVQVYRLTPKKESPAFLMARKTSEAPPQRCLNRLCKRGYRRMEFSTAFGVSSLVKQSCFGRLRADVRKCPKFPKFPKISVLLHGRVFSPMMFKTGPN
jgi:hypothetical protein